MVARSLSSVNELACGLRKDLWPKHTIAVLKAFIDDSGSGGDSAWYVLAGYIGTVESWDIFDHQWLTVLHTPPRIEYFKASEAESLRPDGQWAGVSKSQRDAKIKALIGVIARCARRAICARVSQKNYNEIMKGNLPAMWDSPYYMLSTMIAGSAINIERLDGNCEEIDFVFDDDEKHSRQFPLMLPGFKGRMESFHGSFVNAVRRDEKKFLPLQAADLLAWQIRRFLCSTERRAHYDLAMHCCPKAPETWILGRAELREMLNDMQTTADRLAAELGRPKDLRQWK